EWAAPAIAPPAAAVSAFAPGSRADTLSDVLRARHASPGRPAVSADASRSAPSRATSVARPVVLRLLAFGSDSFQTALRLTVEGTCAAAGATADTRGALPSAKVTPAPILTPARTLSRVSVSLVTGGTEVETRSLTACSPFSTRGVALSTSGAAVSTWAC